MRKTLLRGDRTIADMADQLNVPRLADQGIYLASESALYRVLRDAGQLAHRRPERRAASHTKPKALTATEPNQVYSWDITYLPTTVRGEYPYLYLFLDLFSPKVVGGTLQS